jgi:hypothetical protein
MNCSFYQSLQNYFEMRSSSIFVEYFINSAHMNNYLRNLYFCQNFMKFNLTVFFKIHFHMLDNLYRYFMMDHSSFIN